MRAPGIDSLRRRVRQHRDELRALAERVDVEVDVGNEPLPLGVAGHGLHARDPELNTGSRVGERGAATDG